VRSRRNVVYYAKRGVLSRTVQAEIDQCLLVPRKG
jgi:hypothetical protein